MGQTKAILSKCVYFVVTFLHCLLMHNQEVVSDRLAMGTHLIVIISYMVLDRKNALWFQQGTGET